MHHPHRTALLLACFVWRAALSLVAAEPVDLSRVEPVAADQPVPTQDFFRPALLQQPALNPSGTHIGAIITAGFDRHELLVYELKTQKAERIDCEGDKDIYHFSWLNDQRLVFMLSGRKLYGLGLFALDVNSVHGAYPLLQYYGSALVSVPRQNRLQPLVWNRRDFETEKDLGVCAINTGLRTGKFVNALAAGVRWEDLMDVRDNNERHIITRYPVPGKGFGLGYLTDKNGNLEFAFTMEQGVQKLLRFADGQWKPCPIDLDTVDVLGCGEQPGELVVRGPRQEGQSRALQFMDAATGRLGEVLMQDKDYDFYGGGVSNGWLYRDPANGNILGAYYERVGPHVVWFSEGYRALQKILSGFFPKLVVRIIGSNEAQNFFLVAVSSDRQPVTYQWVDLEKRTAGLFKSSAPWIDPQRMRPMMPLKFKTGDGRQLDAYVTLPAGASKQNPPPLIVLPHGGPWARDTWGFDPEVQFLASRGYAVLQPNYRGSPGTSWMFPESDRWDFLKMHDDVTAAAKTLVASGLVDGRRVAIMGGSFGGYLALSGAVKEPGFYRCAVTIAGVFDWEQLIRERKFDRYDNPTFDYFLRKLGDPANHPERFAAISPVRHVASVRVPVFVAHGKDDPIADISQSKRLIAELDKHHVTHENLLVSEEGHGMGHLKNQVELYSRIEAFLAKHLMPLPTAAAAPAPGSASVTSDRGTP
ncbi:MAG: S9 family peptidase [Opitutae bacterium]|nr:S9 family peptidase [Opitutae bacterium]